MQHYYSENQESKLKLRKIKANLRNTNLEFYTGSGVFSIKRVDKGTEILINYSIIKDNWRILDLGCGYGAIGITIAKAFPKSKVIMSDINKRAIKLAEINAKLNKVNPIIIHSNIFENIKEKFNTILLNPPQTAGKELCFKMIEQSKNFLEDNGLLQIIARNNKGGKVLSNKMKSVFGNMKVIKKKSSYWLYVSEK